MMLPKDHYGLQFFVQYNLPGQCVELFLTKDHGQYIPLPITMQPRTNDGSMIDPLLRLKEVEAQGLFDALWKAGLRPSDKANVDDVVAAKDEIVVAKDEHIADLRRIAFPEKKHYETGDLSKFCRKVSDDIS